MIDDLPDEPTGAELVAAVEAAARAAGVPFSTFLRPLTLDATKWRQQTVIAKHPKSSTVRRVRQLIAGQPVDDAPTNSFQVIHRGFDSARSWPQFGAPGSARQRDMVERLAEIEGERTMLEQRVAQDQARIAQERAALRAQANSVEADARRRRDERDRRTAMARRRIGLCA